MLPPKDIVDRVIDQTERIRKIEVIGHGKTIKLRPPKVTNDDLDILTHLVALYGAWDTRHEENGFQGHAVNYTARWLHSSLVNEGWFNKWKDYEYEDLARNGLDPDVDTVQAGAGVPPEVVGWTYRQLLEHPHTDPWDSTWTQFFGGSVSGELYQLLQDVYALPSRNYISPLVIGGGIPTAIASPKGPYGSFGIGGNIQDAPLGQDVRDRLLLVGYFPDDYRISRYEWRDHRLYGNTDLNAAKGTAPEIPLGEPSPRLWRSDAGSYDNSFPWRPSYGTWGIPPGGYIAMSGSQFNADQWAFGNNGIYDASQGVGSVRDYRGCTPPGATDWDHAGRADWFNMGGQQLGPYTGAEICQTNPTGNYTVGDTGLKVVTTYYGATSVLVVPPLHNGGGVHWYYAGFGSLPDITYPGFNALKERIRQAIVEGGRYSMLLQEIAARLPRKTATTFYRKQFEGEDVWKSCDIMAPYRGKVEVRHIGPHVQFRGFVITRGAVLDRALILLPHGLPRPEQNDRNVLLAAGGKWPGHELHQAYRDIGDDRETPKDPGSSIVPLSIYMMSGQSNHLDPLNKWYIRPHGYNSQSKPMGPDTPGQSEAVILDGLSYVGQKDAIT